MNAITAPTPGSVIRVTTEHPTHYIYATEPTAKYHYTGTVMQPEKWMSALEFKLQSTRGIHIINLGNVIALDVVTGSTVALDLPRSITVMGSKGAVYEVTEQDGRVTCTCPSFTFRKSCKHLSELK